MNKNYNIIDTTQEEHKDIPISLNGEILLEKTYDNNGKLSGYLTITQEKIKQIKFKTEEELIQSGWIKYKHILDSF